MTTLLRSMPPTHAPMALNGLARGFREALAPGSALAALRGIFARELDARAVVLTGSGRDALQLALQAAERAAPGPVALPAFTCFEVASAAVGAAVRPVFYDVDPDTLAPDMDALRGVLDGGARVVVVSPLFGLPVPWDAIRRLVDGFGGVLVEDAAQGHGSLWGGRPSGSLGDLSVLSFGRGKGWTGGGGGALLLRDSRVAPPTLPWAARPRQLPPVFKASAQWLLARPSVYGIPRAMPWLGLGRTVYHPPTAPRHLPDSSASLLLATRDAADAEVVHRRANARRLRRGLEALAGTEARTVRAVPGGEAGYLRLPVRLPGGIHALGDGLEARRLGVEPSYPAPLPDLPVFRTPGMVSTRCPGAEALASSLLTLPTHSRLTGRDRERLVSLFAASS